MDQKKVSVIVPCYNEENSILEMYDRLLAVFEKMPQYTYEIIFSDDYSHDLTWEKIFKICKIDSNVKGIHNSSNFGASRNTFQALKYATGEVAFVLMGDLQEPPERLPEFLKYWEEGYRVVIGVHPNTETKGVMAIGRKVYYHMAARFSGNKIIPNFSVYGVYDKSMIDIIRKINNVRPYFPGIVAEYGGRIKVIEVVQEKSKRGRSNQGFLKRYDYAMTGLTSYTMIMMRVATFVGCFIGLIAIIFSCFVFILKLVNGDAYPAGIPSVLIGVFLLGSIQLFFLGIMGEYILSINERSMNKPLTAADKMLNFEQQSSEAVTQEAKS